MIPLMSDKIKELEEEIASLKEQLKREQNDLAIAHAHIHNLQDAYNE